MYGAAPTGLTLHEKSVQQQYKHDHPASILVQQYTSFFAALWTPLPELPACLGGSVFRIYT